MDYLKLSKCLHVFLSIQIAWGINNVELLDPAERPTPGQSLKVLYSCDTQAFVRLECVVTFDTGVTSTYLLRRWSCVPAGHPKIRAVALSFPDWLVYRADGTVPEAHWVLSSFLRVSLRSSESEAGDEPVLVQDVASLQPVAPLTRPLKRHAVCPAWSSQMSRLTSKFSNAGCPEEKETVYLLSSIYASTGENFGITKTLHVYGSEVLENARLKSVSFPWCMFSFWIFLIRHCQQSLCGVFYHIDSDDKYVTPAMFLTRSGQLHVQMNGERGHSSAFLTPFKVPVRQWCHLRVILRGRTVSVHMVCTDGNQQTIRSAEHTFRHSLVMDDTDGYFVIGGGKYTRGVEGYYGPLVYYRDRVPPHSMHEVVVPDLINNINLSGWLSSCQEFQNDLRDKIIGYSMRANQNAEAESSSNDFYNMMLIDKMSLKSQCEPWEATSPQRRHAAKLAKLLVFKHGGKEVPLASLGKALYALSLVKLEKAATVEVVGRVMPLLLQAGCLGDDHALHISSGLYNTGLGVQRQPSKAWLLALLAAQQDSRLGLMYLGRLHHLGDHGNPPDPDLAYAYYANVAKQTSLDRQTPSSQQAFVEPVYLNDEEALRQQTNEDHHIFQWLELQARHGVADAEQAIGRMLFWGQQGVAPNIRLAVRHYERGAVRLEDPVSTYDYAIVLLQGHGVKKDVRRAVTFLKKAKEQGFTPAINALAWYYEQFEKDYGRAVQLWEEADLRGSPDAAMNLGVMYSQGLYPGKARDQFTAYKYFLKSAQRGHVTAAIHLSEMWTSGIPGQLRRHPSNAALWSKWVAEHNGHLGMVLRKALLAYLKNNRLMALLHYMMAAESGYAAAQFNAAYLCEENSGGFLDPIFAARCMRRYYNLTVHSQRPDTSALIKMGDLFYEGQVDGQNNIFSAVQMYKLAALMDNPQGWYNLGLLVEQEYRLPLSVLIELGLPELYLTEKHFLLTALYGRCRDSEKTEAYLPCSLALFNVYLQSFQRDYRDSLKFSSLVAVVVAAPPILLVLLAYLRGWALSLH